MVSGFSAGVRSAVCAGGFGGTLPNEQAPTRQNTVPLVILSRPSLLQRQGVPGVPISISRHRSIFRNARAEYGSEGCGMLAAGGKGGAGQSTLEVGEIVPQPASSTGSTISRSAGQYLTFAACIGRLLYLGSLLPFRGPVGPRLFPDLLQAVVLGNGVLAVGPLHASAERTHGQRCGGYGLDGEGGQTEH